MKSNWYRKLYEWAWGAGERCYVGKMRSKSWWKNTVVKQQDEYKRTSNETTIYFFNKGNGR